MRKPPELTEHAYTVQEAADLLRVSYNTVRRQIKAGNIYAVKIGNCYRIPRPEIEKLIMPHYPTQN